MQIDENSEKSGPHPSPDQPSQEAEMAESEGCWGATEGRRDDTVGGVMMAWVS